VACRAFLAPQRRHTLRKSRLFWAICFFVTSAIGILSNRSKADRGSLKDFTAAVVTDCMWGEADGIQDGLKSSNTSLKRTLPSLWSHGADAGNSRPAGEISKSSVPHLVKSHAATGIMVSIGLGLPKLINYFRKAFESAG
jgi:hypothetical protein